MHLVRLLAAFFVCLIWTASSWAANVLDLKTEYSATSTIGTGTDARHGLLWRTPDALRHETVEAGRPQIVIARLDRKLAWLLLPDQKLAVEMGLDAVGLPPEILTGVGVRQTPVGQETVAGRRTTKVRIQREAEGGGPRIDGYVWTTGEGIIMKLAGATELEGRRGALDMSFGNVRVGRQDPALFELPQGYRRLALKGMNLATLLAGIEQMRALQNRLGGVVAPR